MRKPIVEYLNARNLTPKVQWLTQVYISLPPEEQATIEEMVYFLCDTVPQMGIVSAFELIGVVGEFLAKHKVKP